MHLQYLAKNQSTQRCQSLIIQGSDHPPVLEPHMDLTFPRHLIVLTQAVAFVAARRPCAARRGRHGALAVARTASLSPWLAALFPPLRIASIHVAFGGRELNFERAPVSLWRPAAARRRAPPPQRAIRRLVACTWRLPLDPAATAQIRPAASQPDCVTVNTGRSSSFLRIGP
jgi:hypothetical protein